jgi:hypothetical protein
MLSPAANQVLAPQLTHLCKSLVKLVIALEAQLAAKRPAAKG